MIDRLTQDLLKRISIELKKKDNIEQINNDILYPIIDKFTNSIYPYVTLLFLMYSLVLVLIIVILFIVLKNKNINF